jgi:hypothetical protein
MKIFGLENKRKTGTVLYVLLFFMDSILLTIKEIAYYSKKDPIYVFPELKLPGLVPNFQIQVSVSNSYISTIGPRIFCSKIGGPAVGVVYICKLLTKT